MSEISEIKCGDGIVRIDGTHGGRIFAELDGELLHRFDEALADHFDPVEFNNLGGNSLWPAPEGGAFAFNYLDGDWLVQPGVNVASSEIIEEGICERTVNMLNHKGTPLRMTFRRKVEEVPVDEIAKEYDIQALSYREDDTILFDTPQDADKAVVAAWSLEQFPGAEGVIAFGCVDGDAKKAVNCNFYGNPLPRLTFKDKWFTFKLGGEDRLQIGVSASQSPQRIGAYDPSRNLLIVRTCIPGDGPRIDIADNDQPNGIYGADDQFSIFNGASLNFFELETIAPMITNADGQIIGSTLTAETAFFRVTAEQLPELMTRIFGAPADLFE